MLTLLEIQQVSGSTFPQQPCVFTRPPVFYRRDPFTHREEDVFGHVAVVIGAPEASALHLYG